ncbi:choice-of-anchor I family protein [Cytobacillus gottheilii]|uniref:choice-of-anchor I family protein n=1 Tax=Cytobacillus gottheilii TaxID=859144 RepID=UPI003CFB65AC
MQHGNLLKVSQIARYDSGKGAAGTEIMAYDAKTQKAFVTNGAVSGFDILSFADLETGKFTEVASKKRLLLADFGVEDVKDITSIAVHPTRDLVAISAARNDKTDKGYIVFVNKNGGFLSSVQVGSLPDMVTFTPDGTKALVANEGEPSQDYSVDPEGSISVIDVTGAPAGFTAKELTFSEDLIDDKVRVSSRGTKLEQLEPEYITVSADSKTAYVAMQENNAIATIDLVEEKIVSVKGLGVIDHSVEGNEMDAIKDGEIKIEKQPILTYHLPDAISTFTVGGTEYIITPNEGDTRDWDAYSEEKKVGKLGELELKAENYAGYTQEELDAFDVTLLEDFKVTTESGFNEETGKYEGLYGFGGRSFSIFNAETLELVYDSGNEFESIIAEANPDFFNIDNEEVAKDDRSNSKGPEPETAVTGVINGKTYAFIALERFGGIMVYDVSNPASPSFVSLISSRDFSVTEFAGDLEGDDAGKFAGDVSPEGLQFIPANQSPTGKALLAATHEVSGTVAVYEFE